MRLSLAYLGRSRLVEAPSGGSRMLSLAPNLKREKVSFDAPLRQPLRFREAISALHDVVTSDLRFKPRDKSAYEEWKKQEAAARQAIYRREYDLAKKELETWREREVPPGFEKLFERTRKRYWDARFKLARLLQKDNPELWRWLMPCDPVITVADDVVFFECFSADESSYGCMSVSREAFGTSAAVNLGTTNVDYSWDLYNHFQSLRTYRETRFLIDPTGFEIVTDQAQRYREEKIDLPPGWLRGFMTTQEAMGMPSLRVSLSREAVYSGLAFLKRHKAKSSPRAVRFELLPDRPPVMVLEPWEQRIVSHGTTYHGPPTEAIRIWGARRLLVLSRSLPLAERFDLHLLGTGLPSFWVAHMGEMTLTLGLSGWTTNDWTRGSALELLAPPAMITETLLAQVGRLLKDRRAMTLAQLTNASGAKPEAVVAVLRRLAFAGQVIHDLPKSVYRFRQVMPMPLSDAQLGPENPELSAARELLLTAKASVDSSQRMDRGAVLVGKVDNAPVEIMIDLDGRIRRGKCVCGHYRKFGIRNGPCRHMIALRYLSTPVRPAAAIRTNGYASPN
jgi:hypothetical protein